MLQLVVAYYPPICRYDLWCLKNQNKQAESKEYLYEPCKRDKNSREDCHNSLTYGNGYTWIHCHREPSFVFQYCPMVYIIVKTSVASAFASASVRCLYTDSLFRWVRASMIYWASSIAHGPKFLSVLAIIQLSWCFSQARSLFWTGRRFDMPLRLIYIDFIFLKKWWRWLLSSHVIKSWGGHHINFTYSFGGEWLTGQSKEKYFRWLSRSKSMKDYSNSSAQTECFSTRMNFRESPRTCFTMLGTTLSLVNSWKARLLGLDK